MALSKNIFLKGIAHGATVFSLIEFFQELDNDLIVEHNGRFVYPREYPKTAVKDGDRLEFINPNFGG